MCFFLFYIFRVFFNEEESNRELKRMEVLMNFLLLEKTFEIFAIIYIKIYFLTVMQYLSNQSISKHVFLIYLINNLIDTIL